MMEKNQYKTKTIHQCKIKTIHFLRSLTINVIILNYCARNNVMYVYARFSSQTRIEFRMKYIKVHSQKVFYVDTAKFSLSTP